MKMILLLFGIMTSVFLFPLFGKTDTNQNVSEYKINWDIFGKYERIKHIMISGYPSVSKPQESKFDFHYDKSILVPCINNCINLDSDSCEEGRDYKNTLSIASKVKIFSILECQDKCLKDSFMKKVSRNPFVNDLITPVFFYSHSQCKNVPTPTPTKIKCEMVPWGWMGRCKVIVE